MTTLLNYLDEHALADELRVNIRTLKRWRDRGVGPEFTRIGRTIYYARRSVEDWLAAGGVRS